MNTDSDCIFCKNLKDRIILENDFCLAFYDNYPVTKFHTLIIPKRHVTDYFSLSAQELESTNLLLHEMKDYLSQKDSAIEGFNIGMNCGEVAGQTIFHCHIHLIPRRSGDVENPRGGIRHLIPGKGFY